MSTPDTSQQMKTDIEILGEATKFNQQVLLLLRKDAAYKLRALPDFWEFPITSANARTVRDTCQTQLEDISFFYNSSGLAANDI
jgi:hypothetical protein